MSFEESKNVEVIGSVRKGVDKCPPTIQTCMEGDNTHTKLNVVSINFLDK